jgi:hypothetical protein
LENFLGNHRKVLTETHFIEISRNFAEFLKTTNGKQQASESNFNEKPSMKTISNPPTENSVEKQGNWMKIFIQKARETLRVCRQLINEFLQGFLHQRTRRLR